MTSQAPMKAIFKSPRLSWPTALASLLAVPTLLASRPGTAEDDLGRLFFTPEQRQLLDRQRQINLQNQPDFPETTTLTIDGVVTRSSGKRTVWINGTPQNDNETPSGIAVAPRKSHPGKIDVESPNISTGKARVGDSIDRNTGETTDLLNGGEIRVNAGHRPAR